MWKIAARYRLSTSSISLIAIKHGVHAQAADPKKVEAASKLIARGMALTHVADTVGLNRQRLRQILAKKGFYRVRPPNGRPWSKREVRILRRDYGKLGNSASTIAAKLGRTPNQVTSMAAYRGLSWPFEFRAWENVGGKPKLTANQQAEALRRLKKGDSARAIARDFNVHHPTIMQLIRTNARALSAAALFSFALSLERPKAGWQRSAPRDLRWPSTCPQHPRDNWSLGLPPWITFRVHSQLFRSIRCGENHSRARPRPTRVRAGLRGCKRLQGGAHRARPYSGPATKGNVNSHRAAGSSWPAGRVCRGAARSASRRRPCVQLRCPGREHRARARARCCAASRRCPRYARIARQSSAACWLA